MIFHLNDITFYDGKISILLWILLASLKCINEEKNTIKQLRSNLIFQYIKKRFIKISIYKYCLVIYNAKIIKNYFEELNNWWGWFHWFTPY